MGVRHDSERTLETYWGVRYGSKGNTIFMRLTIIYFFSCLHADAPQAYPFLPYHPIRVYKVVSTYAELQFNKLMRLVPLFGHFARFQLTNGKKTDMIK